VPPARRGERLLVNGGIVDNAPIARAVELGAHRIYILADPGPRRRALPQPPRSALDPVVRAFQLLADARLEADLARYSSEAELIVLRTANPWHVPPPDFDHADRLISAAHQASRPALKRAAAPGRAAS
jgi:NTE family protein